jgi:4-hydroxy 2-oxovalerate aldolase
MLFSTNKPKILECTLRDGSYAIDFQFTKSDTSNIAESLESVGFDMIELGHGMGLGSSEKGRGIAAETDEIYLKTAAETITKASWGMFCIPGIAELIHIDMAAEYGMNFIRIGTNIESYKQSQPFIEKAKGYGMFVCSNFMKSYTSSPENFAQYALEAHKYGSDLVYIVDSAGGMFPEDIERYVTAVREKSDTLRLGFHGHHNLGMGVANSLKAIELGVEIIDTSLQGFGRSAGNTPTEQLICALIRKGIDINIDPLKVMDIAEKYIQPLITARGLSSLDIVAGLALFHSSYMPIIKKYATQYRVDPRRLIIAICEYDKVNAPEELVEKEAKYLQELGISGNWKALYKQYYGGEQH